MPFTARYVGSLTEQHGTVLLAWPCTCEYCREHEEWDHLHANLMVRRDSDGEIVTLMCVRFTSFTGRGG